MSRAVNQAKSTDGLNLVQANGPGARQSVAHFHVHVLPRKQDGVADRLRFPASRSSEGGEMLAFAHIPTGAPPPTMNLILMK
jgi:diadenosine tetraphosphate (Ap4A) HIT family hydrolase